jgi:hypothetical protein
MRVARHVAWFAVGLATLAVGCNGDWKKETAQVIKEVGVGAVEKIVTDDFDRSEPDRRQCQSMLLARAIAGSAPSGGLSALHGVGVFVAFDAFIVQAFTEVGSRAEKPNHERLQTFLDRMIERSIDEVSPLRLFTPPAAPTPARAAVDLNVPPVGRHRLFTDPPGEPPAGGR